MERSRGFSVSQLSDRMVERARVVKPEPGPHARKFWRPQSLEIHFRRIARNIRLSHPGHFWREGSSRGARYWYDDKLAGAIFDEFGLEAAQDNARGRRLRDMGAVPDSVHMVKNETLPEPH